MMARATTSRATTLRTNRVVMTARAVIHMTIMAVMPRAATWLTSTALAAMTTRAATTLGLHLY
jgi:hypothetical protein